MVNFGHNSIGLTRYASSECAPKKRNKTPPTKPTTRSFTLDAKWRPPTTASPVHAAWARIPPSVTPNTSDAAAKPMVAICERSPHSAQNVTTKASANVDRDAFAFADVFAGRPPRVFADAVVALRVARGDVRRPRVANSASTSVSSLSPSPLAKTASSVARAPNTKNSAVAHARVVAGSIKRGAALPTTALSAVITANASQAPMNTTERECFIAITAAMKNVLSPISLTTVIDALFAKPSTNADDISASVSTFSPSARALEVVADVARGRMSFKRHRLMRARRLTTATVPPSFYACPKPYEAMSRWMLVSREGEGGEGGGGDGANANANEDDDATTTSTIALCRAHEESRARAPRSTLWVEDDEREALPNACAVVRDPFVVAETRETPLRDALRASATGHGRARVDVARDVLCAPSGPMVVDVYERRDALGTFALKHAGRDLFEWLRERGVETRVTDGVGGRELDFDTERARGKSTKVEVIHSTTYVPRDVAQAQSSNVCVMVAPNAFGSNAQAARDNHFMGSTGSMNAREVREKAMAEFKGLYEGLCDIGVRVHLFAHDLKHKTPDAVFPNNWHTIRGGTLKLFPMKDENRRLERREDIIEYLLEHNKGLTLDESLLAHEHGDAPKFLEGTGSLVIDHVNSLAYVAVSERAHADVIKEYCASENLEPVTFVANDAKGRAIYHTNVMMSVCSTVAVACLDSIASDDDRRRVRDSLTTSRAHTRELIDITLDQVNEFCANVIEVRDGSGAPALALSRRAYDAFSPPQRVVLARHFASFVVASFDTIERIGGGGVRCAIAETFV